MSASASGAAELEGKGNRKPASGKKHDSEKKPNIFARIALFIRQVIAELKKVVTPTRKELGTYTLVVLVFVAVAMAFIGLVDFLVGRGVLAIFGA